MEVVYTKCSSGYRKPPWIFKGSALYQLHLVQAETARAFPKEFRFFEVFGYTLGGFFLASYEDSSAGVFDELVVIVWNPPTSCAWAARELVNSDEACDHGRKVGDGKILNDIGHPSQVARFTKRIKAVQGQPKGKSNSFPNMIGFGTTLCSPKDSMDVQVSEIEGPAATDICTIKLATNNVPKIKFDKWMGPAIKMSLPSISGHTEHDPNLLKYSCHIECRVQSSQQKFQGHRLTQKRTTNTITNQGIQQMKN